MLKPEAWADRQHEDASRICEVVSQVLWKFSDSALLQFSNSASGGEVNGLSEMLIERVPAVDFSEADLTGREQRPEQHGGGLRRRQHSLRLDPPLELLVQPLDGVRGARALPLSGGSA